MTDSFIGRKPRVPEMRLGRAPCQGGDGEAMPTAGSCGVGFKFNIIPAKSGTFHFGMLAAHFCFRGTLMSSPWRARSRKVIYRSVSLHKWHQVRVDRRNVDGGEGDRESAPRSTLRPLCGVSAWKEPWPSSPLSAEVGRLERGTIDISFLHSENRVFSAPRQ